jgi:hypothetical protein
MQNKKDVYVHSPDWWFKPNPAGHVFQLKKATYGTKQLEAPCRYRTKISSWMEENGYPLENNEKIIFMERTSKDFIIH